jgi:hypothetical protein
VYQVLKVIIGSSGWKCGRSRPPSLTSLRFPSPVPTVLADAVAQDPTFFSFMDRWKSDVLGYAHFWFQVEIKLG